MILNQSLRHFMPPVDSLPYNELYHIVFESFQASEMNQKMFSKVSIERKMTPLWRCQLSR